MTLRLLNEREQGCLDRYVRLLVERLGEDLVEIVVFGSVARGESWPVAMPIRSDLDLLVATRRVLEQEEKDALFDATLPLFLECGRQISPAFVAEGNRSPALADAVSEDGVRIWPST